jgi:hypothetical protein
MAELAEHSVRTYRLSPEAFSATNRKLLRGAANPLSELWTLRADAKQTATKDQALVSLITDVRPFDNCDKLFDNWSELFDN